jgi:hypothetical protein
MFQCVYVSTRNGRWKHGIYLLDILIVNLEYLFTITTPVRIVENTKMNIVGIHMHTGSDILDIEVFLYASRNII